MAIRPNPTRRCLENPALGSMPGNLSSTSSFLLLPFLRLSSPSAFRVSSARYCRYFQTQHEQPASAMDETMPRDTRRMMEEEERERKTEAYDCWNWNVFRYWDYYILWIILGLLYYDRYWNWNYGYYTMNIVRDVYIFSIFESYIYIVNYLINYDIW